MKKVDLVKIVASEAEISSDKANRAINAIFNGISAALEKGESFNQDKFGTFKIVDKAARKGRNPQTGEEVNIPAKKAPKFIASNHLKKDVNN